jgi:hypothetical protein
VVALCYFTSASKSRTSSLVSSVPFLEPTAHTWTGAQSENNLLQA